MSPEVEAELAGLWALVEKLSAQVHCWRHYQLREAGLAADVQEHLDAMQKEIRALQVFKLLFKRDPQVFLDEDGLDWREHHRHPIFYAVAEVLADQLNRTSATNFVTFRIDGTSQGEIQVTVRRPDGKTPEECWAAERDRADRLEAELRRLRLSLASHSG